MIPMTFALESAPPGMTIDEKTGRIQWEVPAASAGVYKVKVLVKDDHQGWASQEFDVTIGNPVTAKREGPVTTRHTLIRSSACHTFPRFVTIIPLSLQGGSTP